MSIRAVAAASVALISIVSASSVQAFDRVVVFGDSLSDNGNLAVKFGGLLPATSVYYQGRFSNGPVLPEVLASQLGIPLVDFAYGGATSGTANLFQAQNPLIANTGMLTQVNNFVQAGPVDAHSLYMVSGGGNDILGALSAGNFAGMNAVVGAAVGNLMTSVGTLYAAGARDFLVPLLPDLAATYYGTSGAIPTTFLSAVSAGFNGAFSVQLNAFQATHADANLHIFDTPSVLAGLRANMAASGANMTERCWTGDYSGANNSTPLCANPDKYYLFDNVHPTAYVHNAVGRAMAAAVPEPSTTGLAMAGLIIAGLVARRRRAA